MGKKILFAVMALLVMATGKIWAQDTAEKKAYAVLYQNTENAIGSLYFMYTNEIPREKTVEIPNGGSSDDITTITHTNDWEVKLDAGNPDWQDYTNGLTTDEKAKITEVVFEESFKAVKVKKCNNWFEGFTSLAEIKDIKYLDTSEVTSMSYMFENCSGLTTLTLSSLNTSSVTDMKYMFNGCSGLTTLNLSSLNTSSVTDMKYMFNGCSGLTTLDLSSFNTSNVTDMQDMFNGCSELTTLTLSSRFNTSNVTNMYKMFYGCSKLKSLDLSSFNTSKVTSMGSMFSNCSSLNSLTLGSFDMTEMTSTIPMFEGCNKNNIAISGNALVFVWSDQKEKWDGIKGVRLMVKKDGAYGYEGDGTVDITLNNDEDTPVIFPHDFPANNVTFKRTFAAGKPHTVCLPFAVNATEYGTFYTFKEYKDNKVIFEKLTAEKTTTTANTPYLFIPKDGITEITATNTAIFSTTDDNMNNTDKFIGVYEKLTFTDKFLADNSDYNYYGWTAAGDFKKAGAGASVAPCRAYIRLDKETTSGGNAPARLSVEFDDGETTGIDTIGTANSGADAPMYNLQGQRVGSGYKGVVIKNGKKMIVR